jgi:ribosomal-protein-alanine N-acetyltransferase
MMVVTLRKPSLDHASDFLRSVRRSRSLHKGFVSPPSDGEKFREYVGSLHEEKREGFLVVAEESGDMLGVVNVSEIVRGAFQSAYLGYYAFVPFAGRGLMRQGLQKVIGYCFERLKLHRLEANIQPENRRSISLVQGLGFRLEGFSRRYLKVCGRWRDHQRWAILTEEWRSVPGTQRRRSHGRVILNHSNERGDCRRQGEADDNKLATTIR